MSEYALALSGAEVRRYAMMAEHARASEAELRERAGVRPGAAIGDIGCGPAAVSVRPASVRRLKDHGPLGKRSRVGGIFLGVSYGLAQGKGARRLLRFSEDGFKPAVLRFLREKENINNLQLEPGLGPGLLSPGAGVLD